MAPEALTYAIVGGPPEDWHGLEIFDLTTGGQINRVIEVNAAEGWLVRYKTSADGTFVVDGDEVARERIEGRFEIRRPNSGADHN